MKTCMFITVLAALAVLSRAMPAGSNTIAPDVANAAAQTPVQPPAQPAQQPQTPAQKPPAQQPQQQTQVPQQMPQRMPQQVPQQMQRQFPQQMPMQFPHQMPMQFPHQMSMQFPYQMPSRTNVHHQYPNLLQQAAFQMFNNQGQQRMKPSGNSQMSSWLPMMMAMGDFSKKMAAMTMAMQPGQQNSALPYMMMSGSENMWPLMALSSRKMGNNNPLLMMAMSREMM